MGWYPIEDLSALVRVVGRPIIGAEEQSVSVSGGFRSHAGRSPETFISVQEEDER